MLAWSTGTGLIVCWSLTTFAMLTVLMIRMEDNELDQRFGAALRDYRRNIPAVVPRFL
jgi:protein-S-isoprenylcysteine O-methyltransferase Ste14